NVHGGNNAGGNVHNRNGNVAPPVTVTGFNGIPGLTPGVQPRGGNTPPVEGNPAGSTQPPGTVACSLRFGCPQPPRQILCATGSRLLIPPAAAPGRHHPDQDH